MPHTETQERDEPTPSTSDIIAKARQRLQARREADDVQPVLARPPGEDANLGFFVNGANRAFAFGLKHWLFVLNTLAGAFMVGAFVEPLMMAAGWTAVARPVFAFYHLYCDQIPSHSYYLLGHRIALCQRDLAIYSTGFIAGMGYAALRQRITRPLGWRWFLLMMLPMLLDGVTQGFGWRDSTWLLRGVTGVIFAIGSVWLMYPYFNHIVSRAEALDQPQEDARLAA